MSNIVKHMDEDTRDFKETFSQLEKARGNTETTGAVLWTRSPPLLLLRFRLSCGAFCCFLWWCPLHPPLCRPHAHWP